MNTIYQDSNWDENPVVKTTDNDYYALGEFDHLCFTCPLSDCKENSKKCPINIAKTAK